MNVPPGIPEFTLTPGICEFSVTAVYDGEESEPATISVTVPTPENITPENFTAEVFGNAVVLNWDEPAACLDPEFYKVYRNDTVIDTALIPFYSDTLWQTGLYEYRVSADYFFGESLPTGPVSVVISGIQEVDVEDIWIFPNPARDHFTIKTESGITSYAVYYAQGEMIYTKNVPRTEVSVDVSGFSPGLYFIRIEFDDKVVNRKFILQ